MANLVADYSKANPFIVCRFYGSIATALFFPDLEKNTMRQFVRHQREDVLKEVQRLNGQISPYGLVNGVKPDGTVDETGKYHSSSITIGETFCYAATELHATEGREKFGLEKSRSLWQNISLRQRRIWSTTWNMLPNGELHWGAEYYSNMCLWSLYAALGGDVAL